MKYLLPLVLFAVACGGSDSFEEAIEDSGLDEVEMAANEEIAEEVSEEASEEILEEIDETVETAEVLQPEGMLDEDTESDEMTDEIQVAEVLVPETVSIDDSQQASDEIDSGIPVESTDEELDEEANSTSSTTEVQETVRTSLITGRTFMPNSNSGFKCQTAETRGGQTVCLLPYEYTIPPFYTKTDHHGHSFGCNIGGDTFESFTLIAGGTEYPMFLETENPFGPQEGIADYFCANFVGTRDGNIGRTHVRLTNSWESFNGNSVSIRICDQRLCDTLILR